MALIHFSISLCFLFFPISLFPPLLLNLLNLLNFSIQYFSLLLLVFLARFFPSCSIPYPFSAFLFSISLSFCSAFFILFFSLSSFICLFFYSYALDFFYFHRHSIRTRSSSSPPPFAFVDVSLKPSAFILASSSLPLEALPTFFDAGAAFRSPFYRVLHFVFVLQRISPGNGQLSRSMRAGNLGIIHHVLRAEPLMTRHCPSFFLSALCSLISLVHL